MKKYYIEICDKYEGDYFIQSKWYDSVEELKKDFTNYFDFIDFRVVDVYIMSSVWDDKNEEYDDIICEEKITCLETTNRVIERNEEWGVL